MYNMQKLLDLWTFWLVNECTIILQCLVSIGVKLFKI